MRRGYTLVELLVSFVVFGVVMAALFITFVGLWNNQSLASNNTLSQVSAEQASYVIAAAFQQSTSCGSSDSACISTASASNATSTGCTIYSRNSSGTLVQTTYSNSGGNLTVTIGSGTAAILAANTSVTFTYYSSATYNSNGLTAYTPTNSTIANLVAVQIVASDTIANADGDTSSTTYTTLVRIPNHP